jgi:hypothetical protein
MSSDWRKPSVVQVKKKNPDLHLTKAISIANNERTNLLLGYLKLHTVSFVFLCLAICNSVDRVLDFSVTTEGTSYIYVPKNSIFSVHPGECSPVMPSWNATTIEENSAENKANHGVNSVAFGHCKYMSPFPIRQRKPESRTNCTCRFARCARTDAYAPGPTNVYTRLQIISHLSLSLCCGLWVVARELCVIVSFHGAFDAGRP